MSQASCYTTAPLDTKANCIRLVRLDLRASTDTSMACELRTFPLAERPTRAALSYTWGTEVDPREILLNNKPLSIRQNLWHFLHQKRKEADEQWFWIDAICINQESVHERNHQIAMMKDIYINVASPSLAEQQRVLTLFYRRTLYTSGWALQRRTVMRLSNVLGHSVL
jgi:hypothetical protein